MASQEVDQNLNDITVDEAGKVKDGSRVIATTGSEWPADIVLGALAYERSKVLH